MEGSGNFQQSSGICTEADQASDARIGPGNHLSLDATGYWFPGAAVRPVSRIGEEEFDTGKTGRDPGMGTDATAHHGTGCLLPKVADVWDRIRGRHHTATAWHFQGIFRIPPERAPLPEGSPVPERTRKGS